MTNTEITEKQQEHLVKKGIEQEIWSSLKSSIFPGAEDKSILLAWDYCKARNLDILKKPIHIVSMNVKDAKSNSYGWRDVIMPGIAEQRITASRSGDYAGQDAPIFGDTVKIRFGEKTHDVPEYCTVTVYRFIRGEKVGFSHTEYFEEAANTKKDGSLNSMWSKRKRGQLAKCAEAGALRKAFPEDLGGIITADEVDDDPRNVTPPQVKTEPVNVFTEAESPKIEAPAPTSNVSAPSKAVSAPSSPEAQSDSEWEADAYEGRATATQSPEPPSVEGEDLLPATIKNVEVTEGKKKDGSTWTRYRVTMQVGSNQVSASTFSNTIGGEAQSLIGKEAKVFLKKEEKGMKLNGFAHTQGGIA